LAFKAPFLRYDDLRKCAEDFLAKYNPKRTIPVPIEEIIEFQFGMDIVPMPGLGHFDIVAYLSQDMQEIRVDDFVQRERPNRYRLSLAHELAHKLLHAEVFREFRFTDIESWKSLISDAIPEDQYGYLEFQANSFAGLVLAPAPELRNAFFDYVEPAQEGGVDFDEIGNGAREAAETHIARIFQVSATVIHRRIEYDGLWHDD
jgi:hypothetical protein